jgi:hypothetical protein
LSCGRGTGDDGCQARRHPPLPIQAGDKFAADFGALDKVSVALD